MAYSGDHDKPFESDKLKTKLVHIPYPSSQLHRWLFLEEIMLMQKDETVIFILEHSCMLSQTTNNRVRDKLDDELFVYWIRGGIFSIVLS